MWVKCVTGVCQATLLHIISHLLLYWRLSYFLHYQSINQPPLPHNLPRLVRISLHC